jgi:hypothetical protein
MGSMTRMGLLIGFAATNSIALASSGRAGGGYDAPTVIKPYYYQPSGGPLNALDQQRLMVYRDQLQLQQQSLQLKLDRGTGGPHFPFTSFQPRVNPATTSRDLFQTQNELDRVNGLLNPPSGSGSFAPSPMTGSSSLPVLPMGMGTQFVIKIH